MSKTLVSAACLALAVTFSGSAFAQDIFVKFDGMPGTSAMRDRGDWIEASSISEGLGIASTTNAISRGAKVGFDRIMVTKGVDAATVPLREAAASGKAIPRVDIEVKRPGERGAVYYSISLRNVIVQSASASVSKGNLGDEALSLAYDEIRWEFTPIDQSSGRPLPKVTSGWSVVSNKKLP